MKTKRPQVKDSNLAEKYQTPGRCTTVMVRNVPVAYTQDELIEEVQELLGSTNLFDFFYLPWDMQNCGNVGYAFVNFHNAVIAQKAVHVFSNYRFRKHAGCKLAKVLPAHIQGLEHNLRHLQDRAVVHGVHPCSPVVIWEGKMVEVSKIFQELKSEDAIRRLNGQGKGVLAGCDEIEQPASNNGYQRGSLRGGNSMNSSIDESFAQVLSRVAASCQEVGHTKAPSSNRGIGGSCLGVGGASGGTDRQKLTAPLSMGAVHMSGDHDLLDFSNVSDNRGYMDGFVDSRLVQSSFGRLTGNDRHFERRQEAMDDCLGFSNNRTVKTSAELVELVAAERAGRMGVMLGANNVSAGDLFEEPERQISNEELFQKVALQERTSSAGSDSIVSAVIPSLPPGLATAGIRRPGENIMAPLSAPARSKSAAMLEAAQELRRTCAPSSSRGASAMQQQNQQDMNRLLTQMEAHQGKFMQQRPQAHCAGLQQDTIAETNPAVLPEQSQVLVSPQQKETPVAIDGAIEFFVQDAETDVLQKFMSKFGV